MCVPVQPGGPIDRTIVQQLVLGVVEHNGSCICHLYNSYSTLFCHLSELGMSGMLYLCLGPLSRELFDAHLQRSSLNIHCQAKRL